MLNKIFFGVFGAAVFVIGLTYFYAARWLASVGDPVDAFEGFLYYLGLSWNLLWISTVALLIFANFIFWRTRSAATLWAVFLYFASFVILRYFWLENSAFKFEKANLGRQSDYNFGVFVGVILVVVVAVIVFFNHYFSLRLYDRMYPPPEMEAEEGAESIPS